MPSNSTMPKMNDGMTAAWTCVRQIYEIGLKVNGDNVQSYNFIGLPCTLLAILSKTVLSGWNSYT